MRRIFIDWSEAFLPKTADLLLARYRNGRQLDMTGVLLILSGTRSMHRLEKNLLKKVWSLIKAKELDTDWHPPLFLTVGVFPEKLYESNCPIAPALIQQLTWAKLLKQYREEKKESLSYLVGTSLETSDFTDYFTLGRLFSQIHQELATDGKNFSTVIDSLQEKNIAEEVRRWRQLESLQKDYFALLSKYGFEDKQSARNFAVEKKLCRTDCDVYLIGTADLNELQKKMLRQISEKVTTVIYSPESEQDRFDDVGCIIPSSWQNEKIPIPEEQIFSALDPSDQAVKTIDLLRKDLNLNSDAPFPADTNWNDFLIGTPDGEVVSFLVQRLDALGVPTTYAPGVSKINTPNRVVLLVGLLGVFLARRRFSDFAALLRHPDFERFIIRRLGGFPNNNGNWLSTFDRYQIHYYPELVNENWNYFELENLGIDAIVLKTVTELVESLLLPFREEKDKHPIREYSDWASKPSKSNETKDEAGKSKEDSFENVTFDGPESIKSIMSRIAEMHRILNERQLPLCDWSEVISECLLTIYPEEADFEQRELFQIEEGFHALNACLSNLASVPKELCENIGASTVFTLLQRELANMQILSKGHSDGLELVGWLDVPQDNAKHIIVSGFNEGEIPASVSDDLFLPDSLRRSIDLNDSQRRLARDAYAFSTLLHSHPDVKVIFGKRTLAGDPLLPSRFLFAVDESEMPRRVCRFYGEGADVAISNQKENPNDSNELTNVQKTGQQVDNRPDRPSTSFRSYTFRAPILHPQGTPPDSMRVTEFKDFLTCPYRYFLRHQFKLEPLRDNALELNRAQLGNITHEMLQKFGEDPELTAMTDPKDIFAALSKRLDSFAGAVYSTNSSSLVAIQIEQIRKRLKKFADWQAEWRQLGNEIRFVEKYPKKPVELLVDGKVMTLRGRIDRIDYNPELNIWFVFDYKTFDSSNVLKKGKGSQNFNLPRQMTLPPRFDSLYSVLPGNQTDYNHRKYVRPVLTPSQKVLTKMLDFNTVERTEGKQWINLQLPLYRHFFDQILKENGEQAPEAVYFACLFLPGSQQVLALGGPWDENELQDADDTACWVVRTIWRLWNEGVDPEALIDPRFPEKGYLFNEFARSFYSEFAPITLENLSL